MTRKAVCYRCEEEKDCVKINAKLDAFSEEVSVSVCDGCHDGAICKVCEDLRERNDDRKYKSANDGECQHCIERDNGIETIPDAHNEFEYNLNHPGYDDD